ncbi:MAG: PA0069 family radical SAM protein [Acidobacteriia bacterium]|nr:PA0069 family radical SAM protein [Terriglobia bacterium]
MPKFDHGRGAAYNPPNRFHKFHIEPLEGEDEQPPVPTEFYVDSARSILAENDSPDVPFTYSINPYRGCEHGCIYCYARQTHEYLGFSAGVDFESKILVKPNAPELLEQAFRRKSWRPQPVCLSGNTDCYQPVERRLELTRRCLRVFLKYRNPVTMITKSHLITRDLDILKELARLNLVSCHFSITTLDPRLARIMEPRAATPSRRMEALRLLAEAGVATGVSVSPVIPGLTDEEIPAILRDAAANGAKSAVYIVVRLPLAVEELFVEWLARHMPARSAKILNRLKEIRGGKLSTSDFDTRKQGEGKFAESLRALFEMSCRKFGLSQAGLALATHHFTRDAGSQRPLF